MSGRLVVLCCLLLAMAGCGGRAPDALPPGATTAGAPPPTEASLVRHFTSKLDHAWGGTRQDGMIGLGRLGAAASPAAPRLLEQVATEQGRLRLLGLWALARIGTPEALRTVRSEAATEARRLEPRGLFDEDVAIRVALLAAADAPGFRDRIDAVLPALYTSARGAERLPERLAAAWALLEIGTPVTVETALRALSGRPVAAAVPAAPVILDPEHSGYTTNLDWVRLTGPRAAEVFVPQLEDILEDHDFDRDLFGHRQQTAFTLARLVYPEPHPLVVEARDHLVRELDDVLTWSGALRALPHLGPYACSPATEQALRHVLRVEDEDDDEHARAVEALEMCSGGAH